MYLANFYLGFDSILLGSRFLTHTAYNTPAKQSRTEFVSLKKCVITVKLFLSHSQLTLASQQQMKRINNVETSNKLF